MKDLTRAGSRIAVGLWAVVAATAASAADLTVPALPDAEVAGPAALPFASTGPADHNAAVRCLASAVYYEAGGESLEGRQAVAQVVLNRVRHPAYPKSVCGVVYQGAPSSRTLGRGCQFTFACDGSLVRTPDVRGWRDAQDVAERALDGFVASSVGAATHYHTLAVHPVWSAALTPVIRIGAHQFYRFPRGGAALTSAYAGVEPQGPLVRAAMRATQAAHLPATPTAPQPSAFSVWGLQIARVTPQAGGLMVASPGT